MPRPKWLRNLDAVKTTVEQARTILRRNKALLKLCQALERSLAKTGKAPKSWGAHVFAYGSVDIGCPHCIVADDCRGCEWDNYPKSALTTRAQGMTVTRASQPCGYAPFDGVTLMIQRQPIMVLYNCRNALIQYYADYKGGKRAINASIRRCYKFLKAHIRWAEDVIQREGN